MASYAFHVQALTLPQHLTLPLLVLAPTGGGSTLVNLTSLNPGIGAAPARGVSYPYHIEYAWSFHPTRS